MENINLKIMSRQYSLQEEPNLFEKQTSENRFCRLYWLVISCQKSHAWHIRELLFVLVRAKLYRLDCTVPSLKDKNKNNPGVEALEINQMFVLSEKYDVWPGVNHGPIPVNCTAMERCCRGDGDSKTRKSKYLSLSTRRQLRIKVVLWWA